MTDRRFGPGAPVDWAPLIDEYITRLAAAGQPETTLKLRRIQLVRMARDLNSRPAEITGERLVAWFGSHTEWKTETRRSYRSGVRGFFRWAYQSNRIPHHIADELPKVREKRGAPRPAPDHAWREALSTAEPRVAIMLRLAGEAGLRRGEIARVHTRDLLDGVDGAQLVVHGKGDKQRVVPLGDSLAELIRQGAAGHSPGWPSSGWLFPSVDGDHLSPWWVGDLVKRALPDQWTCHTLRHRFASRAFRGSRNLRAVQMLLGHESISTTERYCAVDDDEIRAAMMSAALI
jgi:integrase